MLYMIPDYYKEFSCAADQCEDTCCAGWQIVIDDKSLKRYRQVRGPFQRRMMRSVKWRKGVFRQSPDRRCAFLNEDNLCDMYTMLGKNSLCKTCRLYPRHIEEFEGVREITLSVSCPEAAKILLARKEPVQFLKYEKEGTEEYEDFDLLLYSWLVDAREVMLRILQDRTKGLDVRTGLVLGLAYDMEGRIRRGELFSCQEVFEKYQTEKAVRFVEEKLGEEENSEKRYTLSKKMFGKLYELELLNENWFLLLNESEKLLYGKSERRSERIEKYETIRKEYVNWQKTNMPDWQIPMEQLLVYFIFTYFCGAVYDGRVYGKVQMAVVSVLLISELLMARWLRNGRQLDQEDMTEIVYRYSRELEHSDKNPERFEEMMEREVLPWFQR